jgi:hypothetical protein
MRMTRMVRSKVRSWRKRFERWGLVWAVNVDGRVIETTAQYLQVGDVVRLREGWGMSRVFGE